jgi:DNA-binding response OmpR family regulator
MIGLQILLIADDSETARIWRYALTCRGAEVTVEPVHLFVVHPDNGQANLCDGQSCPDLVVLDLTQTPTEDVLHLCALARAFTNHPLLLFAAQCDEALCIRLYNVGVDECVFKPVSPALFLAKVRAWARHSGRADAPLSSLQDVGGVHLNPLKHEVTVGVGSAIHLTRLEFRVLQCLMGNCGHALDAQEIICRVWGYETEGGSEVLKSIVYRLRRKLEDDPRTPHFIHTLPGLGYMFMPVGEARAEMP